MKFRDLILAFAAAAMLFMFLCMTGCKTCVPIVEVRDSVRVEYRLDSVYVYQHDSVWRDRWRNGDTIFVQVEKYKTLFKDKIVEVHDTIATNTEIVQEVQVVKPFYRGCTIAFWVLLALVVVGTAIRILIKIYLKK